MAAVERVDVVDIDEYTEPASEPGYYAIYLRLSREPSPRWRELFEREWQSIPTGFKRRAQVVGDRVRIEIHGDDLVREQVNFAAALVERTNAAAAHSPASGQENGNRG
ncbi:MAG: hypothetical protein H0Z37_04035 [Firmicutes bacterium]|nr:hypothetical protein [Bacillota bacterium]